MARTSPTQRTLALLREQGYECCIVERWIERAKKRVDAFGFGDLLACDPEAGIFLVQTTSGSNHASHRQKILDEPRALTWLESGGHILLITWRKLRAKKKDGKLSKRSVWTPRIETITERDFDNGEGA